MSSTSKKVVIIGGGITGLSAAYYLQKEAKQHKWPIDTLLLEATDRLGGKVQTFTKDGFTIERGPDSVLARKASFARLVKEVGLEHEIVRNATGQSFILAKGKLHPMPKGAVMGIPTQITPFVFTDLFSWPGKFRAAVDFVLPKSNVQGDQSLGLFFRRRFGNEVVENLIEPLLSGIYAGDIDRMSLMATFPNFYHLEQKYRSLVFGLKKTMPKPAKEPVEKPKVEKQGMFISLKSGLESLVQAVEEHLEPGTVRKNAPVQSIERVNDRYHIILDTGETIEADSIILATPHHVTQKMLAQYPFFEWMKDMPSTSVANVALAFPKSAIKKDLNGTGYVVSRNSDFRITACTWTHKKWLHSTPDDKVLFRTYVGRPTDEGIVDESDEVIAETVLRDLRKTMDITGDPEFYVISRWKNAMPQYTVGHKDRLEQTKKTIKAELPGVYLAGASYEGIGLPDCIDQGEAAVRDVIEYTGK